MYAGRTDRIDFNSDKKTSHVWNDGKMKKKIRFQGILDEIFGMFKTEFILSSDFR